ncbi:hypothetical protein Ddc_11520 [Ditylenchus destructor]|nr:hypothetical protein Ddc_11520 [Ditylenchus destructor]
MFVVCVDNQTTDDPDDKCGNIFWCPPGYGFAFIYPYGDFDCKDSSYPLSECTKRGGICASKKTYPESKSKCHAVCCMPEK